MSISLPNGTLLAAPSSSTVQYSAAVTRILHLANFSAELKTRDLQAMFREYESEKGGFRIKWLDDINALVVFADASTAKKAYLAFLLHPPPHFQGQIRPYDKPDAAQIIQSIAARNMGHRGSASQAASQSGFSFANGAGPGAGVTAGSLDSAHSRTLSSSSGWGFPPPAPTQGTTKPTPRTSISSSAGPPNAANNRHHRASSSSAGGRQPLAGVLNFNSGAIGRLSTHRETPIGSRNAVSPANSSDTEPIISLDPPNLGSAMHGGWKMGGAGSAAKARRESLSAEKALREVEKALAGGGVDVHG